MNAERGGGSIFRDAAAEARAREEGRLEGFREAEELIASWLEVQGERLTGPRIGEALRSAALAVRTGQYKREAQDV